MKFLFSNYLGDYSYGFKGSSELFSITVTVSLFFLQNAANGGVTNGGLGASGLPSWKSAEIGLFRPFSAFFTLFRRVRTAPGKSRKRRKKAFFLRYPRICLNPHLWHSNFLQNGVAGKNSPQEFPRLFSIYSYMI